jgi:hypothetical protein
MKQPNELSKKISKINNNDKMKYAEEVLKILYPYAKNYLLLWIESGLYPLHLSETKSVSDKTFSECQSIFNEINKDLFSSWINKATNFKEAKERLVKKKLLVGKLPEAIQNNIFFYTKQYALEIITATAICWCCCVDDLNQVVFVAVDSQKFIDKHKTDLLMLSRNFELESDGALFRCLVDKLNNKGSIYNSGKPYSYLLRDHLTKRIMQSMFIVFGNEINCKMVTNIALDITGIFFYQTKHKHDANKMAELVKNNCIKESVSQRKSFLDMPESHIDLFSG